MKLVFIINVTILHARLTQFDEHEMIRKLQLIFVESPHFCESPNL